MLEAAVIEQRVRPDRPDLIALRERHELIEPSGYQDLDIVIEEHEHVTMRTLRSQVDLG